MNTNLALTSLVPLTDVITLTITDNDDPTVVEFLENGSVSICQVSEFGDIHTIVLSADMAQRLAFILTRLNPGDL